MREQPQEGIFLYFWNPSWPPMDNIVKKECFVLLGFSMVYRLKDDLTYWAETWWDDRWHMPEQPREGFLFFNFLKPRWPPNGLYSKILMMHISNKVKLTKNYISLF